MSRGSFSLFSPSSLRKVREILSGPYCAPFLFISLMAFFQFGFSEIVYCGWVDSSFCSRSSVLSSFVNFCLLTLAYCLAKMLAFLLLEVISLPLCLIASLGEFVLGHAFKLFIILRIWESSISIANDSSRSFQLCSLACVISSWASLQNSGHYLQWVDTFFQNSLRFFKAALTYGWWHKWGCLLPW